LVATQRLFDLLDAADEKCAEDDVHRSETKDHCQYEAVVSKKKKKKKKI